MDLGNFKVNRKKNRYLHTPEHELADEIWRYSLNRKDPKEFIRILSRVKQFGLPYSRTRWRDIIDNQKISDPVRFFMASIKPGHQQSSRFFPNKHNKKE